tara:strand:+ start:227 stop:436 length:210 start_codon:yes stop_codon:yes gene_type:complete
MEIALTVIGVLVFFGGSYFIGNLLVGHKSHNLGDKLMEGFFGMLVMSLVVIIVGLVSVCVHVVVVSLIN